MSELSISNNQIKKINNNAKCIYFTLTKKRQDRSLTYKDKMVFTCLSYIIPVLDDLLIKNQDSLVNASRLKNFLLATSLLNLGEEQDFSKYNLPLFDYQYNVIKYNLFKKYKNQTSDFNQIEANFNNVKLNFDIMFERDAFHTKGMKLIQILESDYPYLLGRDINNIIRVNLGYLYSNMYSRLEEMSLLFDYRDLKDRYINMYLEQSFYLLKIIFNEYECKDMINRSHQLKNKVDELINIFNNQQEIFENIISKLKTINSNSYLQEYLNQLIKVERSCINSIENKRMFDMNLIYIELVKLYINLSTCNKDSNTLINYNFNQSFENLDPYSSEFKYRYNEIKGRITTPNLYSNNPLINLFKNSLQDSNLEKDEINMLIKEFELKSKITLPNSYLYYGDINELLINKKALISLLKLILNTIKDCLLKFEQLIDFNKEIEQLNKLIENINEDLIY